MRIRSLVALGLASALIAAACSPDDEVQGTTTTTAPATTPTAAPATTATSGPFQWPEVPPEWRCYYQDGFVAIFPKGEIQALPGDLEFASAGDVIPDSPAREVIDNFLDFVDTGGVDPLQVALELGPAAAPIYVTAPANHWRFAPGTDAAILGSIFDPHMDESIYGGGEPFTAVDDPYIGVVDTGMAHPGDVPARWQEVPWLYENAFYDVEVLGERLASHGTFIASLLRQLAPTHYVAMTAPRFEPISVITRGPGEEALTEQIVVEEQDFTISLAGASTEMHVFEAIVRLVQRQQTEGHGSIEALNLSLGTYTCDPTNTQSLTQTLVAALNYWFADGPGTPVFAAAGNERYLEAVNGVDTWVPFWPAAIGTIGGMPDVHSIAALALSGTDEVVWDHQNPILVSPGNRIWVSDRAPGCDLLGVGGGLDPFGDPSVVMWSGSSFASAVATAASVAGFSADYASLIEDRHFIDGPCDGSVPP